MKLVMAGLPAREAAALAILVGMVMKGWQSEAAELKPGRSLPSADLYVLDLAASGLQAWSAGAEANLLQTLHGRPAVLIHAARDTSWITAHPAGAQGQTLVWLAKPYNTDSMRVALGQAAVRSAVKPATTNRPTPALIVRESVAPAPAERDNYAAPTRSDHGLAQADVSALHHTFPDLHRHAVLSRIVETTATGLPHEVRLTVQHSVVIHPQGGWVASSVPFPALERSCRLDELASAISVRPLSDDQAHEWAQRVATARSSLDAFLWSLATAVVGPGPLKQVGDAELRLRGFPDYTRLKGIPDFFIQLAAICVRLPQTLSALQAAFPGRDPQDIRRFAMLSTVCGLGHLSLVKTPARAFVVHTRAPAVPVKRGFFQAMLARLF